MTLDLVATLDGRPAALETRGLTKSFGSRRALAGLDLTVPEGSVYVLVGPNGAGKTTTLKTVVDLVRPDGGSLTALGRSPSADGPEVRARIGYVPEAHDFGYTRLPVGQLLDHHAVYYKSWDAAYAARLAAAFEVDASARFGKLSKGQTRRVQLILALAHRPALLLLDEPTDGLDPLARDDLLSLLAEHLEESPTTALVSTHLVHELGGLGDCLGVLKEGRLVAQQTCDDLDRRLRRLRGEVPEGWRPDDSLAAAAITRRQSGREIDWVAWGEEDDLRARLEASGATVRQISALSLEDATRALLRREVTS